MRLASWTSVVLVPTVIGALACSSDQPVSIPDGIGVEEFVAQAVETMEGLDSMRVELSQSGAVKPLRATIDVVGDDFRTHITLTEDENDAQFELLALGEYVYLREGSSEWIRRERPEYVPTMGLSTILRFETYPLAALEEATELTMSPHTGDGLVHVTGRVNHLQALFEHQARESPEVFGNIDECDSDPSVDLDGDGVVTYEEAFAETTDYVDIGSVPLSDIEAWIRPEDRLVERIVLVPPPTLEGGAEFGTDGSLSVEYSGFNSTTLVEPVRFVDEFEDSGDDVPSDFEEMPPTPEGLEALSKNLVILGGGVAADSTMTIGLPLVEPIDDAEGVGFYSFVNGNWIKLDIVVRVTDDGCGAEARLGDDVPENIGVLREK